MAFMGGHRRFSPRSVEGFNGSLLFAIMDFLDDSISGHMINVRFFVVT